MIKFWDYLMRRKMLLFWLMVAFVAGSFLGYKLLNVESNSAEPEYISINTWQTDIEIPHTGEDLSDFVVMSPDDLTMLPAKIEMPEVDVPLTSIPEIEIPESNEGPENLDHLEELEMPDSATMEILPPKNEEQNQQIVAKKDREDESEKTLTTREFSAWEIAADSIMSVIVLGLGGYLTYWHFRR